MWESMECQKKYFKEKLRFVHFSFLSYYERFESWYFLNPPHKHEWVEKVRMMTSYLLLMTFLTKGIQAVQHMEKKCLDLKWVYLKNEPYSMRLS